MLEARMQGQPFELPPPSHGGGGAPFYGAEGEGQAADLRKFQIGNRETPYVLLSPSGPAGHLPRMTGEASERRVGAFA